MRTKITELSKSIKCLVRKRLVANTPEEAVRQSLIRRMIVDLGYPKGLIAVEKQIESRRFDLVCYTQAMSPLLLVECKAEKFGDAAEAQAFGYNATIKAPFICLASLNEVKLLWHEKSGKIASVPFLPTFAELYAISQRV